MSILFEPLAIGDVTLPNRIVLAPLTRCRTGKSRVPNAMMCNYYTQRADAGLMLTEATIVSSQGAGYHGTAGIWNDDQVSGWKAVTESVHRAKGRIFLQLWHCGRVSDPEFHDGAAPVAPSALLPAGRVMLLRPFRPYVTPRALETDEVRGVVEDFRQGARNAKRAGFDGVEIHAANGYLIDQFLQDKTNRRADRYGGSIENRSRFLLEIVDACSEVWGPKRVGVHLRPRMEEHDMGDSNPRALFTHVAAELGARGIGFLFIREIWGEDSLLPEMKRRFRGAVICNELMSAAEGERLIAAGHADAVAFGRDYVANPDLVDRIRQGAELTPADTATFFTPGAYGYDDYLTLAELKEGKVRKADPAFQPAADDLGRYSR